MACLAQPAHAAGDPFGWHYSTSTHITPANVDRLEPAWTHRNGDMATKSGPGSSVSAQATPILLPRAAGEHLVYCTPFNRVIALDPATGAERWSYDPQVPRTSERPYRCRGVAYAELPQADPDRACRHRIYTATNERRLIALDARHARPCAGFGQRGIVTLVEHERYGLEKVSSSSAPVAASGVVVVGSSVIDFAYAEAPRGVIAAFDAATGAPRWTFDPGETFPLDRTASTWTVYVGDAVGDRQDFRGALSSPAFTIAEVSRLACALGANAYALFGVPPAPFGTRDPFDFAPALPEGRARLDRAHALILPDERIPYAPPPPAPPRPWAGECPDGHGPAPKAFPDVRRGRYAHVYRCATCGKPFDRDGFTLAF